jgi:hypothetical protein
VGSRVAWLTGGALGGLLLVRRRRRRRPASDPALASDPAAELRRKLDESRALVGEREDFESAETPVDRVPAPGELDERRRRVHERGRTAVDEMRGDPSEPG